MPRSVRWFLIAITVAALARASVLLYDDLVINHQQATCRAEAMKQYNIVSGWVLPAGYPSHYDAVLNTCTFFYQSGSKDYWMDANSGILLAEEDSPGNAFKETCFFQSQQIDCAHFEQILDEVMSQ